MPANKNAMTIKNNMIEKKSKEYGIVYLVTNPVMPGTGLSSQYQSHN